MHLGTALDDPYLLIGVAHDAPDAEVRRAWKAALSETHPDRARSRGLPQEFIEVAEAKAAAINAAFDAINRERKSLSLQAAS
jgi:DnaJ like chaperone protein